MPPGLVARRRAAAQVLVGDPGAPVLASESAHHLERVLRLADGETVVATDGRGRWTRCRYRRQGTLELDGTTELEAAPVPALTVAFTPVKAARPEWVVQKLTELGIDRIVILSSARSVVRWDADRAGALLGRLRRVAAEASAQSRRVWLPEVVGVVGLDDLEPAGTALAEPGGPALAAEVTGIAVGPEGGWSADELSSGWPTVGLAAYVLRTETAAIAAGVLLGARRAGTVSGHGE
ncbi:MAG: RsmE family RNA methyltransferase [Actinomycetota bacterium]|jgi:16S rRNA (uracil1498-N3)-methyltransferase|nr:RsmE family RNA methyltransferase [Actinomycetota bacterium]